jgi:hypothetical protein
MVLGLGVDVLYQSKKYVKFLECAMLKIISEDDFCVCLFVYFDDIELCNELAVGLLCLFTIHKHKSDMCKQFGIGHCV